MLNELKTVDETNAVGETLNSESRDSEKNVAPNKKMSYNQYRSERLSFENGNSQVGTIRTLFNTKSRLFEVWEKGNDTIILLGTSETVKGVNAIYERIYGKETHGIRSDIERFRNSKGKDIWDTAFYQDRTNGGRNSGQTGSERAKNDTGRSGANLLSSDKGKSLSNEPSSTDGGFSMPGSDYSTKRNATDSNGGALSEQHTDREKQSEL